MAKPALASVCAVILAAGQGTRMKSSLPKVLHTVAGLPLIHHPVQAALDAGCGEVVVVLGHGRAAVEAYLEKTFGGRVRIAVQETQRGTGDAARAGLRAVSPEMQSAVLYYGDCPLLEAEDIRSVAEAHVQGAALALAVCTLEDPTGYGRILRDDAGAIREIREQKDLASDLERGVKEINPGIYAASVRFLNEAVDELVPNNAQGELYLTDIVRGARQRGLEVVGVLSRRDVLVGINDRRQLRDVEEEMFRVIADRFRQAGVTVRGDARIERSVVIENDVVIESGVSLRGRTFVERGATIDVGCVLTNVHVGPGTVIRPYSVLTDSKVGASAQIGPFSHLRPDSQVGDEAHVGNFVELKKTKMAKGSKANHLAYLGDGDVGEGANIGAGTIFCNYDGFRKHTTTIERGAFIGSDSQLVAPVRVGEGAYVGSGTTVTRDVPPFSLALSRVRQENREGYAEKIRQRCSKQK